MHHPKYAKVCCSCLASGSSSSCSCQRGQGRPGWKALLLQGQDQPCLKTGEKVKNENQSLRKKQVKPGLLPPTKSPMMEKMVVVSGAGDAIGERGDGSSRGLRVWVTVGVTKMTGGIVSAGTQGVEDDGEKV